MRHLSGPANPLNAFHKASCIADFIVQIATYIGKQGCPVRRPARAVQHPLPPVDPGGSASRGIKAKQR